MARKDIEIAVDLITSHIQSNIAGALASVSTERADDVVSLPSPQYYFNYSGARADRCPAVFIVPEEVEYNKRERGANFVFGTALINVAVILEEQRKDLLSIETWRYQAALLTILDEISLTTSGGDFKIKLIVRHSRFLEDYSASTKPENMASVFRKGVELELDVEMYEQLVINGGS